ncbi:NAD(P)H-hydrate epimerase [Sporomusaceae bacterium BoRhaA]|uniref:NAD(P)H-hydrate dehydratase n=1 Tax=Pelorhabdus rhamnosifermentans TaxID=2772457 RepID=UPI001C063F50|nr:NAD(P)H-hydrate dehydratase [Pelorhabdus rhamnosifermentans]MBU2702929.1 NAD(P)H-hydrate epimerase [Pelorhabdus rhamnosifermentans]
MKVATAQEMKQIDRKAIDMYGIPGVVLMENAGTAIVKCLEKVNGSLTGKKVIVLAGKGNNGGDGFVIARHLANHGAKVKVFLFCSQQAIAGDAKVHLAILVQMGLDIMEISGERDWDRLKIALSFADYLVDALVGTGFHGRLSATLEQAVSFMNQSGKPIYAVDIPSGVQGNDGQVTTQAVKAAYTVTFGLPKPGLLIYPGADYAGKIIVDDIGVPTNLLTSGEIKQNVITALDVLERLPKRTASCHKGDMGWAFIVAGSEGFTGAAALAAQGALRSGAGKVTLGVGESIYSIAATKLTEVMVKSLPDKVGGVLTRDSLPAIQSFLAQADVLALGPGLGRDERTLSLVTELIQSVQLPLVIDADALYAVAKDPSVLGSSQALCIVTPHPGEMAALTGLTIEEIQSNRLAVARQYAAEWKSIVILKGAATIVAFPDGEVYINTTGNVGMATGGTGDVLTGMITAFIAQGCSSHDAAIIGVYLHGLAGDLLAENSPVGMTAGDLAQAIPAAVCGIYTGKKCE